MPTSLKEGQVQEVIALRKKKLNISSSVSAKTPLLAPSSTHNLKYLKSLGFFK